MTQPHSRTVRISNFSWLALFLAALPVGGLAFLALVSRVYGFWFISRWPRLFLFGIGVLLTTLLISLLLRGAWSLLAAPPRAAKLLWLGAAFTTGILIRLLAGGQTPAIPIMHVLDISTAAAESKAGQVTFIELRDHDGRLVLPVDLRMEGDWQRRDEGWVALSGQPARLHYSFYAPARGNLQVLFGEQPDAGQVQVDLDGQSQLFDLSSPANGQRLVDLPFQKHSRWETPILIADLALVGLVFPLLVFVLPFYTLAGARWSWPRLRAVRFAWLAGLDYQKLFIAVFIGLCFLPFLDYKGSFSSLDSFFLQGNRFWTEYARIRQNVFGDRFIGGVLVGEDGWLILSNDFSLEDYQNTIPFSEEELYQIQQRIDTTTRFLKAQGITFLVVIPPNKNTIYPDEMPAQIEIIGKQSRLDQLLEYQRSHGETQILDLRPALLEARKERLVYHKTDTHWNDYGAHAAYLEIMQELQKQRPELPGLKPHTLDEFRYVPGDIALGDMGRRWAKGALPEPSFSLEPLFDRQVNIVESFQEQDRVMYSHQYNVSGDRLPVAVIFHDSYMDWLAPFLSDHFQRAVYVRALDDVNVLNERLIEGEKPDIVIFECNERGLKRLLVLPKHEDQGE